MLCEKRSFGSSMRCIVVTDQATTRAGSTSRRFRRQRGRTRPSNTARGAARSDPNSSLNPAIWWPWSTGVRVVSLTRIWIRSSEDTGIDKLIIMGLIAHTCVEATVRYAAELGYEVTIIKDAMADYSDKEMHAALDINIPNYANAIVTTNEIVESISSL